MNKVLFDFMQKIFVKECYLKGGAMKIFFQIGIEKKIDAFRSRGLI